MLQRTISQHGNQGIHYTPIMVEEDNCGSGRSGVTEKELQGLAHSRSLNFVPEEHFGSLRTGGENKSSASVSDSIMRASRQLQRIEVLPGHEWG